VHCAAGCSPTRKHSDPMITKILAATVALAASAILPMTGMDDPAPSDTAITWALQPSSAEAPDGRISLRHTVAAGDKVDDVVALTNFSATPARFALYASDGTITADGSFDLIPSDQAPVDSGAWVSVAPVPGSTARDGGGIVVDVPAASSLLVPLSVTVPENATPGDHPAGLVAELVPESANTVTLATRVGVRLHLRVTGDLVGHLVPQAVDATYSPSWNPFAPGTVTVRYAVENAGNIRLGAATSIRAAGPFGLAESRDSIDQREILPGQEAGQLTTLPVWPLFVSWGEVVVDPAVVGTDEGDIALSPETAGFTVVAVPWSQLALLAVIAAAVLGALTLRRRARRRMQEKIDEAVAAATSAPLALAAPTRER